VAVRITFRFVSGRRKQGHVTWHAVTAAANPPRSFPQRLRPATSTHSSPPGDNDLQPFPSPLPLLLLSQHLSASIVVYRIRIVSILTLPSDLRPPGLNPSKWVLSLLFLASSSPPQRHYGQSEHHVVEQLLVPCCVDHVACRNFDPPSLPELHML